ncbi:hypothetical protein PRUPE_4G255800 [Prunus persica]|uniref:DUF659 domain-containing protein n=1 Tax=Prunus persica TaxID=3760 RepID=A0A251PQY9_PRUPE|nr:hypothetical protein PRUPE_4G255800 [Prunus persica]
MRKGGQECATKRLKTPQPATTPCPTAATLDQRLPLSKPLRPSFSQRTHKLHQYLAQWVYEACIPFHAIDNNSFKRFVEVVDQFGSDYRPPSQYQLREPLLKEKEDSEEAHTRSYIFEYIYKCIEEIGPQNVVQVVTNNASNNMEAANMLKRRRRGQTSIGNLPRFKRVIEKAKSFTIFIYAHHNTLALMRKYTKRRDIVRQGVIRFATSFLTLQILTEKNNELRSMVASDAWDQCKHCKTTERKAIYSTILSIAFWNWVSLCLRVFDPLVKVIHLVDRDKSPSMSFLYGELLQEKEEIKEAFKNHEANYHLILQIVDAKAHA